MFQRPPIRPPRAARDPPRAAVTARTLCLGVLSAALFAPAAVATTVRKPVETASAPASRTVTQIEDWVLATGDNHRRPFVIIDKIEARVFVFSAKGRLTGAAPALLGLARGDDSAPGVGQRKLSAIRPEERTTPAGRFIAAFGPGEGRTPVLWVDYDTAISLHPVITSNPKERRLERLRSSDPQDNRITYGCINVSAVFYRDVVRPAFASATGVVYILPETRPLEADFPGFRTKAPPAGDAAQTPLF